MGMRLGEQKYNSMDMAILVPTKDRPEKIWNFLENVSSQTMPVGRIVIIDGGETVRDVVMSFADRIPVEHHLCIPPGQIRQRNLGISLLDETRTPLVAFLDDDILLSQNAIEKMLLFWNRVEANTAAVSFNMTNETTYKLKWFLRLAGIREKNPGRVLKSGFCTGLGSVKDSMQTQWVLGGATVWRTEVVKKFLHKEVNVPWAVMEDVIYSYPIGLQYPLYVCADAQVIHDHPCARSDLPNSQRKVLASRRGQAFSLWTLYFVSSREELSKVQAFLFMFMMASKKFVAGVFMLNPQLIAESQGIFKGLVGFLLGVMRGESSEATIERAFGYK